MLSSGGVAAVAFVGRIALSIMCVIPLGSVTITIVPLRSFCMCSSPRLSEYDCVITVRISPLSIVSRQDQILYRGHVQT